LVKNSACREITQLALLIIAQFVGLVNLALLVLQGARSVAQELIDYSWTMVPYHVHRALEVDSLQKQLCRSMGAKIVLKASSLTKLEELRSARL
jgi:hypothetical protein